MEHHALPRASQPPNPRFPFPFLRQYEAKTVCEVRKKSGRDDTETLTHVPLATLFNAKNVPTKSEPTLKHFGTDLESVACRGNKCPRGWDDSDDQGRGRFEQATSRVAGTSER